MNKLLLALLVLGTGAAASARLNYLATQSRIAASQAREACGRLVTETTALATAAAALRAQVEDKRTRLDEVSASATAGADTLASRSGDSAIDPRRATPDQLRRRFGIGWNNSPDYVLVSKAALKKMYLRGVEDKGTFTPAACAILAINPTERETIEAALKQAGAEHADWAKTAVRRGEPAGDVVADYRLPANKNVAERELKEAEALVKETLGAERADMLRAGPAPWLVAHGNLGLTPIRFTVRRFPAGHQPPFWTLLELQGYGDQMGEVRTGQFPEMFRPIFPGGWRDLAQREGFALPEGVE